MAYRLIIPFDNRPNVRRLPKPEFIQGGCTKLCVFESQPILKKWMAFWPLLDKVLLKRMSAFSRFSSLKR